MLPRSRRHTLPQDMLYLADPVPGLVGELV